jgi:LmbE family N-acetylglucosaminyl deacetylase
MRKFNRALVLAPHTDDAELGCGATMSRLLEEGTDITVIAFSTCENSLPKHLPSDTLEKEFMDAMTMLGIPTENILVESFPVRRLGEYRQEVLESLINLRSEIDPEIVFIPSGNDMHQDHSVIFQEGLRAFKHVTVLGYELPWNHIRFDAQAFFSLEERHVEKKLEALHCYKSQIALERPYFDKDFLKGWLRLRGTQVKTTYAEAYEVLRVVW